MTATCAPAMIVSAAAMPINPTPSAWSSLPVTSRAISVRPNHRISAVRIASGHTASHSALRTSARSRSAAAISRTPLKPSPMLPTAAAVAMMLVNRPISPIPAGPMASAKTLVRMMPTTIATTVAPPMTAVA